MLDLDAVQARIDGSIWPNPRGDAAALVAELRAAREVIRVGRELNEGTGWEPAVDWGSFDAAIAAYDKVVS